MTTTRRIVAILLVMVTLFTAFSISPVNAATTKAGTVTVTGDYVNIRKGAGTSYEKVACVREGSTYTYLGEGKDGNGRVWYKIQYNSSTAAWITSQYSKFTEKTEAGASGASATGKVTVTGSTVNIRSGAGTNYAKIGTAKKNAVYNCIGQGKDKNGRVWYQIQFGSKIGWITSQYSKYSKNATTTTTTTGNSSTSSTSIVTITGNPVNVRKGAGYNYAVIAKTYAGKTFNYLGTAKDSSGRTWYKIKYNSSTVGWVLGSLAKVTTTATPTTSNTNSVQGQINSIAQKYGADGVQVAIIDNGMVVGTYNYGYATKSSVPMTSDHKIRVASLSKVAVAVNAMKMQEQGIVDINTNIGTYWGASLPKAVTLRSLLTHTSTLKSLDYSGTKAGTLNQLKKSGNYRSGTVGSSGMWAYNNYAVGVAGSTLEVASGKTLTSYAKTNIFGPLGMDAAFSPGAVSNTSKLATLYYANGNVARSVSTSKGLTGSSTPGNNTNAFAGGLTCSAQDYAKLIAMLANNGTYNGVQILTPASVATIETKLFKKSENGGSFYQCMPLRYKANLYGESELYYHTGNAYGVLALASYNPATGDGVVVITTGASATRDSQGVYAVCSEITSYMYKNVI